MKKSGIQLIAEEREQQISKHGKSLEHDVNFNDKGELLELALFALTLKADYYPSLMSISYLEKIEVMPKAKRLKIAGALIAAEIDRLQVQEVK